MSTDALWISGAAVAAVGTFLLVWGLIEGPSQPSTTIAMGCTLAGCAVVARGTL